MLIPRIQVLRGSKLLIFLPSTTLHKWSECGVASAAGALWRMMAAENLRGVQTISKLLSSQQCLQAVEMLRNAKSSRARDNALKVIDFLQKTGLVCSTSDTATRISITSAQTYSVGVQAGWREYIIISERFCVCLAVQNDQITVLNLEGSAFLISLHQAEMSPPYVRPKRFYCKNGIWRGTKSVIQLQSREDRS